MSASDNLSSTTPPLSLPSRSQFEPPSPILIGRRLWRKSTVTPRFREMKLKPLYVWLGCLKRTYSNNMMNIYNILLNYNLRSLQNDPWVQKTYYRAAQKFKRRCGFHRHNRRRGGPRFLLFHPTGTPNLTSNLWIDLKQR
jgi:hypothetical protein